MRRLMVSEFMSLDGVAEAPGGEPSHPNTGWVFPYHDDDLLVYKAAEMREAGALLLGRVTYEGFAQAWPGRTGDIADQINGIPKYVASSTLRAPLAWNNSTLLEGDLVKSITSLKQQKGAPIMVHGSMALTQNLLAANLVDDLRLMIFPVTVGGGRSIYPDGFQQSSFTLTSVETVLPNVMALTYSRGSLTSAARRTLPGRAPPLREDSLHRLFSSSRSFCAGTDEGMVDAISGWKQRARQLKGLVYALYFAYRDPRTPWPARIVAACVVGYAFSPIDLIPDPIPILGYLDDIILLPLGVALAVRLIPPGVWADAQLQATDRLRENRPVNRIAAIVIVAVWLAMAIAGVLLVRRWLS